MFPADSSLSWLTPVVVTLPSVSSVINHMLKLLLTLCQYNCVICISDVCDILSIDVYSLSVLQCFSYQVFRVNVEQTLYNLIERLALL